MVLFILLFLLLLLLLAVTLSWIIIAHENYTGEELLPGSIYRVSGRTYVFPNLPTQGHPYKLKDNVIEALRRLYTATTRYLDHRGIEWFVTGGTLLGVERHRTLPMPFDDDIDLGVDFSFRDTLFDEHVLTETKEFGIRPIYLFANGPKAADRHGSAVRFQLLDGPDDVTLDIFFWYDNKDEGYVAKLDGWGRNGELVESRQERFPRQYVYPLQTKQVDGLRVRMAAEPQQVLKQQYSDNVMHSIVARPLMLSHAFPYRFLKLLWLPSAM